VAKMLSAEHQYGGTDSTEPFQAGDALVKYLHSLGVKYIFGIPGGAIEPLFDALDRSEKKGGPRVIVSRHETGSVFMAEGYARNTGRLGGCCATTGPGATNLITGIASAYQDNIPLLVITAQTSIEDFGRKAFQESSDTGINILGMFEYCTAYNSLVSHIDQFERKLISAITVAMSESKPVHLSIPRNILRKKIHINKIHNLVEHLEDPVPIDTNKVDQLSQTLVLSTQPVFIIGGGCAGAISQILKCAFLLGAKIVTTPDGKGLVSPYHPLFQGVIGFAGHKMARDLLESSKVDRIVAIGTALGEWAGGWDSLRVMNERLIHIDRSAINLSRSPIACLHIKGDITVIFEGLLAHLKKQDIHRAISSQGTMVDAKSGRLKYLDNLPELKKGFESKPILPQWLMMQLPLRFPSSTKFFVDVGNSMAWGIHFLNPYDRRVEGLESGQSDNIGRRSGQGGLFQATIEFASMGWAIGASIGAALANRKRPIVCITGDGSLLMNGQEMTVALQENLSIVFIVLNDGALGMVKHGQILTGARRIGYELPEVDFAAFAKSMGVRSFHVSCPQDLDNILIDELLLESGPTLLDVNIDKDQIPPISTRTNELKEVASSKTED